MRKSSNPQEIVVEDDLLTDELDSFLASIKEPDTVTPKPQRERSVAEKMKSTLREEPLSSEICSLQLKGRVGNYTVFESFSKYFAIGTTQGLVILFDNSQKVKHVLGLSGASKETELGQVSSIDYWEQFDWILVGYSTGKICIWEAEKAQQIKLIVGVFTSPVIRISFLDEATRIIASDTEGNIKLVSLTKVLLLYAQTVSWELLLPDGPVIDMDVILIDNTCLVAFATRTRLFIYDMKGAPVLLKEPIVMDIPILRRDQEVPLPYLTWRPHSKKTKPTLAVAHARMLRIYEIDKDKVEEDVTIETQFDICGLVWTAQRVIIIVDAREQVFLIDPKSEDSIVESYDITHLERHYDTTFGSVKSFHSSLTHAPAIVYIMGKHTFSSIIIKPWDERVDSLIKMGLWPEALSLADDFHKGRGRAVIGLPEDAAQSRQITSQYITDAITKYLRVMLKSDRPNREIFKTVGTTCVDYCLRVHRLDILFNTVHETFQTNGYEGTFLELLEPFILKDELKTMPSDIFDKFVYQYSKPELCLRLDQCISRLDLSNFEFEKVLRYCKRKNLELHQSMVYAYNEEKGEYITPLALVMEYCDSNPRRVAEVVIMYMQKYLTGQIKHSDVIQVTKADLLDYIFHLERQYSPMLFLIQYYPVEFFNVLDIAFGDQGPTNPWGEYNTTPDEYVTYMLETPELMQGVGPFAVGRTQFFVFYAKFLSQEVITVTNEQIIFQTFQTVGQDILEKESILPREEFLYMKEDREDKLVNILRLYGDTIDKNDYFDLIKDTKLSIVAQYLYFKSGKWQWYFEVCKQRIKDTEKKDVPDVAYSLMYDFGQEAMHSMVIDNLQKMCDDDHIRHFVFWYITHLIQEENANNPVHPNNPDEKRTMDMFELSKKGFARVEELAYDYLELLCEFEENRKVKDFIQQQSQQLDVDRCLQICKNVPEAKSFLLERTGEVTHALREIIKELERKLGILQTKLMNEVKRKECESFDEQLFDTIAHNFSRITNDPAFYIRNVPMADQDEDMKQKPKIELVKVTRKRGTDFKKDTIDVLMCKESRELIKELKTAINLCGQNSERKTLDDAEVNQLWFKLLDTFLLFLRRLRYGYVNRKALPERVERSTTTENVKRRKDDSDSDSDNEDLSEIESTQKEIVEETIRLNKLEKELNDLKDQKPPDEEEIEKVTQKIRKKKDHIMSLQFDLRELEENERKAKQVEEERNNDVNAPHNVHKLVNLWLQRVNTHCIRLILGDLMRYVDIPTILNKIVDEHQSDQFGHIKITLMRMLDSFTYKCMLLYAASELISYDTFTLGHVYHEQRTRGIKPKEGLTCLRCESALSKPMEESHGRETTVRLFPCGHAYHTVCIGLNCVVCPLCIPLEEKELKQLAKNNEKLKMESKSLLQKIPSAYKAGGQIRQWDKVNNRLDKKPVYQVMTELETEAIKNKAKRVDNALEKIGALFGTIPVQHLIKSAMGGEKLLKLRPPSTRVNDQDMDDTKSQSSVSAAAATPGTPTPSTPMHEHQDFEEGVVSRKKRMRATVIGPSHAHRKTIDICDFQEIIDNLI